MIADTIFGPVGVVGMAGAEFVAVLAVILGALVFVVDHQADGRASRLALKHAGENAYRIAFAPLGDEARLPGLTPVEPGLDVALGQRDQRRTAVDDTADGRPVTLTPGGEAEQAPEAVIRQDLSPLGRNSPACCAPPARRRCAAYPPHDSRCRRDGLRRSRLGRDRSADRDR